MSIIMSIGGQPDQTYETPWAAVMALLPHLTTKQLGGHRWLHLLHQVKAERTKGLPTRDDVGANAIPEKNPGG